MRSRADISKDFQDLNYTANYRKGGDVKEKETMGPRGMGSDVEKGRELKFGEHGDQKRGHTRDKEEKMKNGKLNTVGTSGMKKGGKVHKYAKGGSVRGDGVAERGHTKGKVC